MLRVIKPCKLLSGWTNIVRTSQTRVASTAFSVQPALNNNTYTKFGKNGGMDKVDRIHFLAREVMKNNQISENKFQLSLNSIQANSPNQEIISLIQCFGIIAGKNTPEERINYVNKIWNKLKSSGVKLDVSHYNTLLSIYVENEHKFSATEILEEMEKNNVKPNRVTYRYLLSSFCREGDLSGASSIMEMMKNESISYNEYVFHELILGHCIAKDINGAENIIKIMQEKNFDIGSLTYTAYLCGLALSGDMEKFNSVFKKCEEDGIVFRREYLINILYNLVMSGHTDRACEMIQSYSHVLREGLSILILRVLNKEKYNECLQILSVLDEENIQNNIENTLCNYIAEKASYETIKNIANDLEKKGKGSDFLLKTLFYTLKKKEWSKSLNIIRHLRNNGHMPKEVYFWPIVASAVQEKSVNKILNILTTMRHEFGLKFSRNLFVRVIFNHYSDPLTEQRLLDGLHSLGTGHFQIQENFAFSCILRNRIDKIYELSEYIKPKAFSLVVDAIVENREARSPAKVVGLMKNMASSAGRRNPGEEMLNELNFDDNSENVSSSPQDVVDNIVKGLASRLRKVDHEFLKEVFEEMVRCNLPISKEIGEYVKTRVNTPNVADIVDELVKLPPLDVPDNLNNENNEESKSINDIKARYQQFCTRNMIEEAEKLLEEHPELLNNYSISFMMALKRTNNEEKFKEYLMKHVTKIRENGDKTENSMFLITELFRNGFIKEASATLADRGRITRNRRMIMEALGPLLDKASVKDIATLLSASEQKEPISLHNIIYYYSGKRNFAKIIELLEELDIENPESLRLVGNLIKPLVEDGETEMVKKVVSIMEEKFPSSNMINELIFSYSYTGDINKARKCLDKFSRKSYFFASSATNIQNDKIRVNVLENMVNILMGYKKVPKKQLYERLIEDYETLKMDPEKGLALWEQMQDDMMVASPIFLLYLTRLLKGNNMPIPFDHSNIEDQEWLLDCNIPRPVLNELLDKCHLGDINGIKEVIRQGIKSNLIQLDIIKKILRHCEGKENMIEVSKTFEQCLTLAEYKQALDEGRLLQHATNLAQSSDPKIILKSIPHTFLVECLMTESFDRLPDEIAQIIMWAYAHEVLHNERLAHMYETEVKNFINQRPIVEGLLKFAQYLTVKPQILNFLISQNVFEPHGLEKEATFLSRIKTGGRQNFKPREQSSTSGTESEGVNATENTYDEQAFDTVVLSERMSDPKSTEEEVIVEEKRKTQAVPSGREST